MYSILPFEVDFYEKKHHYPIHYVGNPTAHEVRAYKAALHTPEGKAQLAVALEPLLVKGLGEAPIIALLAGSRKQEIKDNLPAMLEATKDCTDYTMVVAGAPGIDRDYYGQFVEGYDVKVVYGQTYDLLANAHAALVTSGTATLEACCFNVPQVVCYETPLPKLIGWLRKRVLKVEYVSLVNLVADREVVTELVADTFSIYNIKAELQRILSGTARQQMLDGYAEVRRRLGESRAPVKAAETMVKLLNRKKTDGLSE